MSPESAKVKHGLLQSCPLSPLLLSTAFLAWERRAAEGRRDQTTATVCVDDRTFWHTGDSGTDHKIGKMMQDLDMGKKFNEPFGLLGTTRSSRMRKTTLSPRKEVKTIQELAKYFGANISILGIDNDLMNRSTQVHSKNMENARKTNQDSKTQKRFGRTVVHEG